VDAAAAGCAWFSAEPCNSVLFAHFGDRIRSGLTVDCRIHRGADAGLGLGTGVVEEREGGGTLQGVASGEALCEAVRREVGRGIRTKLPDLVAGDLAKLTLKTVSDAAEAGDILAFNVLDRAGRHLGAALAWAVCVVNPERLVLAGELVRAGGPLTDAIRHEVSSRVPQAWEAERRLVFAPSDEEVFVQGAAALALQRLFGQDDETAVSP
jgi:predicted NBD/HSP70 family sugar kinase